jgi:hypothetical protein
MRDILTRCKQISLSQCLATTRALSAISRTATKRATWRNDLNADGEIGFRIGNARQRSKKAKIFLRRHLVTARENYSRARPQFRGEKKLLRMVRRPAVAKGACSALQAGASYQRHYHRPKRRPRFDLSHKIARPPMHGIMNAVAQAGSFIGLTDFAKRLRRRAS